MSITGMPDPGPGTPKSPANGYVLYVFTRYQDCHEEHTYAYDTMDKVLECVNSRLQDKSAMHEFHLFELGPRVQLEFATEVQEKVERVEMRVAKVKP
jgi:hypothetical protein